MSNDKPPAPQQPRSNQEPIPVKTLRFRNGEPVDIPGKQGAMAVVASPADLPKGAARHILEYLPWQRHHRITFFAAGSTTPQVLYVHETWATYEPA